jgi:hypothetical protein
VLLLDLLFVLKKLVFYCCFANLFDFFTENPKKDKIIQHVSKMEEIPVKKKKLVEINKIGMGIEICIEVPNWLMLED